MICHGDEAPGRLNAFQRVIYQWSLLHPYNATHTYKIAGPARPERLGEAIGQTYRYNGLGRAEVSPDGLSYRHDVGQPPDVPVLPGGDQPESILAEYTVPRVESTFRSARLPAVPFRSDRRGPGGALCDHDLRSLGRRQRVRAIGPSPRPRALLRPVDSGKRPAVAALSGDVSADVLRGKCGACDWRWRRRVRCVIGERTAPPGRWPIRRTCKWPSAISCTRWRRAPVEQLRHFARSLGATVHDVVLAALARTMGEFLPRRSSRGKSREMSLGTTVDTRPMAEEDLSRTVGMFLAYYLVRRGHDRGASLAETTRQVAAMTRPIKQRRRYLDSLVNMKVINAIWPSCPNRGSRSSAAASCR